VRAYVCVCVCVKAAHREHYFLDTILTVVVIHQLIVFYWRGSWEVLDHLLFPNDQASSAVASLVIGYALHSILCLLQPFFNVLYRKASADLQGNDVDVGSSCRGSAVLRWFLEVVFFFISNLICVVHWRGIWLLLDLYVLPGLPNASAGLTHAVGVFGLWLLGAGHSVTLAGCLVDGDAPPEEGCLTKNEYVRHFVERHRSRLLNIAHDESQSDSKAKNSCSGISCCL
jgi:Fuseless